MHFSDYDACIAHLFGRFQSYQIQGQKAFKPGLETIKALCSASGNPQDKFPIIHVAGTNGKGSVVHNVASGLFGEGYRVGVFASPHLVDFRERFRVNGEMCSKQWVVDFWNCNVPILAQLNPSFFEITTWMAFQYFAEQQVDYACIEVGMGGRLDSTNVVNPVLTVITRIGWDHVGVLGDSLEEIAVEKAGIIKAGVPLVIGPNQSSITELLEATANETGSGSVFSVEGEFEHFQEENWATSLQVLKVLFPKMDWTQRSPEIRANRFERTGFFGRWECLQTSPQWVVDCCHNEDGWNAALAQIGLGEDWTWVLGFSSDKSPHAFLEQIPEGHDLVLVENFGMRAMQRSDLEIYLSEKEKNRIEWVDVTMLPDIIQKLDNKGVNVFIGGSVFLIGEILSKKMLPMFGED